jgi:ferredoxin-type protein NapH
MQHHDASLQLTPSPSQLSTVERAGLLLVAGGMLLFMVAAFGAGASQPLLFLGVAFGATTIGAILYFRRYARRPAGVDNDGTWFSALKALGAAAWVLGVVLTGLYVLLYWFPGTLEGLIRLFDPLSAWIRGREADRWFMYGSFYTFAVLIMGVRAFVKYRHSRYQMIRTFSVVFFQLGFAFLIPSLLVLLSQPEYYFSYFWPLKYDYLWPSTFSWLTSQPGGLGVFMLFWGAVMSLVATPVLTYFYGKRWYCSWVCGCGGLAETAGDPFRHLSDTSLRAWRIERWMIHSVLVLVVLTTVLLWASSATGGWHFGGLSGTLAQWYGFGIGLVFSGVIGVGFYPIMGSRVWCRYGCPMAAILGLQQKWFSRFRITTNGGQCISCGNCSTYCEMGIDVRWYAQRGQNVIRASCVGCGICATVCPRGVLKLENGPREDRYNGPVLIDRDELTILTDERWEEISPSHRTSSDQQPPVMR